MNPLPDLPGRLPFVLPDFTRIAWVSAEAKAHWQPRIAAFGKAWHTMERISVASGIRQAALQDVTPENLAALTAWATERGLIILPLERVGVGVYAATTAKPVAGQPWSYRCAFVQPGAASQWLTAWQSKDPELQGRLLGFPPCCRRWFVDTWGTQGLVDGTWAAAANTPGATRKREGRGWVVEGVPEANILGRWLGVRLVPHLPCSFGCPLTQELAGKIHRAARAWGFTAEWQTAITMLSWPWAWSAWHGLGEVHSPVCRISTRTDATADRLDVHRLGDSYPDDGASGLVFPYRMRPVSDRPAPLVRKDTWTANGFSSDTAMLAAHQAITKAALAVRFQDGDVVLDLGCGDGTLSRAVRSAVGTNQGKRILAAGIERDPKRLDRNSLDWARIGDLTTETPWPARTAAVLLMPGRLVEATPDHRAELLERLKASGAQVVVYGYGDWLERYGGLVGLVGAAGLNGWMDQIVGPGVAAALLRHTEN